MIFVSKIKICNGKQAYGQILIDGKEYTFTITYDRDTLALNPVLYAAPIAIDEKIIFNAYYDALEKKEYLPPAVVKQSLRSFWE